MMKISLSTGFALILLGHVAQAQPAPNAMLAPPPPATNDQAGDGKMPPPPPGDHEASSDWDHGDGEMMHPHGRPHRMPPPTKAARFRLEAGDISLGMTCPEDEPLKACAEFTLQLLDKLGSLPKK
ncbi:hypothetical protein [Lichenifustis flavocetrariae]|uniref:Uncharacterized protein n=1 Tax=Lichenifustis flavocetrariae TaxID=2949735 RepID=A0AA41YWQ3_9HYPH|nr:hypothetical protein [Lichenifustis flavocetrariae]MCW6509981.1 hypothetical protein [Lichenifustis flavocetrariae]